ncbi:hypothetical protein PDESU_01114 [Pontiella desulfatans]|uniref:Uncharacterized protein n=2 Tax=Pontiella desulfatans TaxID=2750659 RepID=A0A6C2TYX8_PONDE|nr:hypothetical protein PDESU_01114 [Pontiella desulfatans]
MNKPDTILPTKEELESKSRSLANEIITIPLYDSAKRTACILKHITGMRDEIARRICDAGTKDKENSEAEPEDVDMDIVSRVIAESL